MSGEPQQTLLEINQMLDEIQMEVAEILISPEVNFADKIRFLGQYYFQLKTLLDHLNEIENLL